MSITPEGGGEFLKRRLSQEIQKFQQEIITEVFSLYSTHYILEQEQSRHVIQLFIEAIQQAVARVEFSSDFRVDGSLVVQVRDSDF